MGTPAGFGASTLPSREIDGAPMKQYRDGRTTKAEEIMIRLATREDLDFVDQHDSLLTRAVLEEKIACGEVYVAEHLGRLVGVARYNYLCDLDPFLTYIFVLEPCRRQGFGSQLMRYWEERMKMRSTSTASWAILTRAPSCSRDRWLPSLCSSSACRLPNKRTGLDRSRGAVFPPIRATSNRRLRRRSQTQSGIRLCIHRGGISWTASLVLRSSIGGAAFVSPVQD